MIGHHRTIGGRREHHFRCEQAAEERKAERCKPDRSDQLEPHFDNSCVTGNSIFATSVDAPNQP
jgi:hypothetical protein